MYRDLNQVYPDGKRYLGSPRVGEVASAIPATGDHGPALAHANVVANGWASQRVLFWVRSHNLASLFVRDDSSFSATVAADGAYQVVGDIYLDGVLQSPQATVSISVGVANTLQVTGTIVDAPDGIVSGSVNIAATATPVELQVTGTIVDAPDGIVSGSVTIAAAAAPEELLITGAVLGDAEGVVAGSVTVGSGEDPVPVLDAGLRSIRAGRLVPQKLAPLDVAEADNLTADMGTVLAGDDPIVDVLLTSEDRVGDDGTENPLLFGDWQVQGHLVRQRIVGWRGSIGVTYLIRVQATAQSGKVAVATAFVKVVRLA